MKKERIYITDIALHTRSFRQTTNFSKAAKRGRIYSPLPKYYTSKSIANSKTKKRGDGLVRFTITLPEDMQARLNSGELEIMVPKDGIDILAGDDVLDFIKKRERKEHKQLIHQGRARTWKSQ